MTNERRPLLAANWKQNMLWEEIEIYCAALREQLPQYFDEQEEPELDFLICPPLCYLGLLGALLEDSHVLSGAQTMSVEGGGAFTGEVSAAMLADLGSDYIIIGHSERRRLFGENEESIGRKLSQARAHELVPILCIGEDLECRRSGQAVEFVLGQLMAQQSRLLEFDPQELVLAYEPIWAIGTGENASEADAQAMCLAVRGWLAANLSPEHAALSPILYGGSVRPDNIAAYFSQADIDGALVGGASLQAESMVAMLAACLSAAGLT